MRNDLAPWKYDESNPKPQIAILVSAGYLSANRFQPVHDGAARMIRIAFGRDVRKLWTEPCNVSFRQIAVAALVWHLHLQ
jgi:hypothetical protein